MGLNSRKKRASIGSYFTLIKIFISYLFFIGTEDSPDGVPKNSPYLQIPTSSRRSKKSVLKPLIEFTEEERSDKLKQQALTNDFHKFVEGHLILKQGILDKKKGLFAK